MKKAILLTLVLLLGLAAENVDADFTFGTPTNLGPLINSSSIEAGQTISPDGLYLYFSSNRPGGHGDYDLWMTQRLSKDSPWTEPVNLGPVVNSSAGETVPCLSVDGLSLYFCDWPSARPGGYGDEDLWVTTRETIDDEWGTPVNLGSVVNSSSDDWDSCISTDGLSLFFDSSRPGGQGDHDLWMTQRLSKDAPWAEPVNLGPTVNSPSLDAAPSISADGLILLFTSERPGGLGDWDLWMTHRETMQAHWIEPVNLGPTVNSSGPDGMPNISADGSTIYFFSKRPGGEGGYDIWQVPVEPVIDLNSDGIVDGEDLRIIGDHWGTDDSLCDIGPMPWGDGVVDVQDLIVIAEYLQPAAPEDLNVNEEDDGGQVELEQGQILVVTLESNPTTGYSWEQAENQPPYLEQMGHPDFISSQPGGPPIVGAGGWEIFRFKAISKGQMTLKLIYHRPWEEGVEPINTFSIDVVIK